MKKMLVCCAVLLFISHWCSLGAMKSSFGECGSAACFNDIVKRAQWHFNDPSWLASNPVLKDHHDTICEFLAQREFSSREFLDFLEEAFDYYLLLNKQWEKSHDLIACRVCADVFKFFQGFGDYPFVISDKTEFFEEPQLPSLEVEKRLGTPPLNQHGLEADFWYIFAFRLKETMTAEELEKVYTVAYVQDDLLSILDGLKRIDSFGCREEAIFGRVAAQIIFLMQKLDVIANLRQTKKLSWKTATFFDLFQTKVVKLCTHRQNNK
jgi:hypothetical protein